MNNFCKNLLLKKSFQMLSDQIETVGKIVSYLLAKTFSEKSFQTLSDLIETVGMNLFPTFWQKPSLRNCFRRFRTKFSLQERIGSYLLAKTFSEKSIWDGIESGGKELFLTISCLDGNHMLESIQYKGTKLVIGTRWGYIIILKI